MKWRKVDDYYAESDAGYRVSRSGVDGDVRYAAWAPRRSRLGDRMVTTWDLLGVFQDGKAAADACEDHARAAA